MLFTDHPTQATTKTPSSEPITYQPTYSPITSKPVTQHPTGSPVITPVPTTQSPIVIFPPSNQPTQSPSYLPSFLQPSNWPSLFPSRSPSIAPNLPAGQAPVWVDTTPEIFTGMNCITSKGTQVLVTPLLNNATQLQKASQWLASKNITKSVLFLNTTSEIGGFIPFSLKTCSSSSKLYEIQNPSVVITQGQVSNPNVGLVLLVDGRLCFFARAAGNVTVAYTLAGNSAWYFSNFAVPDSTKSRGSLVGTNRGLSTPPFSLTLYGQSPCLNSTTLKAGGDPILLRSYMLYKQKKCLPSDVTSFGVWTSSNSNVAMILQNGTLIPLKPGIVTIYFFNAPCVSLSNKTNSQYELETTVANINTFTPKNNVQYDLNYMISMSCSANFIVQ